MSPTTLKRHLTRAVKNPRLAFEQGWYQEEDFCDGFFDRCENLALEDSPDTLDLAMRAVDLAMANGDQHLINRGNGVLVHAHIARGEPPWAGRALEFYREQAMDCCPLCRSHFFRRKGDLLGETRQPREAIDSLRLSLIEGGEKLTEDILGRTDFLLSIAYFFDGDRDRALAHLSGALARISLDSPRGFFLDGLALLAVYIRGGDPEHDALGLRTLADFERRIKGLKYWNDARIRKSWVGGVLHGRLGEIRPAREQLEITHRRHLEEGLDREVVASAIDVVQLRCRRGSDIREDDRRLSRILVSKCKTQRSDLSDDFKRVLDEMEKLLKFWPRDALVELETFRNSFAAPVPGRLGERL